MGVNPDEDVRRIVRKMKRYRLKGKGPVTLEGLNKLDRVIGEMMQEVAWEERRMAALSEIEARKIIIIA
jgi:hypothetical protein